MRLSFRRTSSRRPRTSSYNDVALHLAPRGAASTNERDWVASVDVHFPTPVCALVDSMNASVWIGRGAVDTVMERFDLAAAFENRAFSRSPAATTSLAYDATSFRIRRPTGADTSLKKDRPLNVYVQFRLSEDLSPGDEVEVWLPRSLSNPDQLMPWVPIDRGLPIQTRWQAQLVSINSNYLSPARPREGESGVVLRLNATEGLSRDGFAAVGIATALEGGVDLLPPSDRLRPYRAEGLDDRVTLASSSKNCPLPPTLFRGAPRFCLQGSSVDIYIHKGGARDASIGIPGEPANALLDGARARRFRGTRADLRQ